MARRTFRQIVNSLYARFAGLDGYVIRTPQEEAALRTRIIDGRHLDDALRRVTAELGERAEEIGPVNMARNTLGSYTRRKGRAYAPIANGGPPMATGLGRVLANAIGDSSASVVISEYQAAGGYPLPSRMVEVGAEAIRYEIGCNFAGVALGWSDHKQRPTVVAMKPGHIRAAKYDDDPMAYARIGWLLRRTIDGDEVDTWDVSDLTDPRNPRYLVLDGDGNDLTERVLGEDWEWPAWLRYAPTERWPEGRPFHRFVISGNPDEPYRGGEIVEATLRAIAGRTHWWAGIRDAGHPLRYSINVELDTVGQSETGRGQGMSVGPEHVVPFRYVNPDKPGTVAQLGPGFDVEAVGRALRADEADVLSQLGIPVDLQHSGGEPAETEQRAWEEAIAETYASCRGRDTLTLRRCAAICNRRGEMAERRGEPRPFPPINEYGYGVLYRGEITRHIEALEKQRQAEARRIELQSRALKAPELETDNGGRKDPGAEDQGSGADGEPEAGQS